MHPEPMNKGDCAVFLPIQNCYTLCYTFALFGGQIELLPPKLTR